jgi:hypothetical protein
MNIPQPPEALSSQSGLGGWIETFPLRKGRRWAWLVAALILLVASAGVKIYGITLAYLGWKRYGAAVVGESLFWPLVIAAGLFLSSLIFAGVAYANWTKAIVLYQNGFAYKDRRGLHPWRWRDVATLRMAVTRHDVFGIHTGTTHAYTVENRSGNWLALNDGFTRVEELARVVEENTFPLLFEQAAQQYNFGRNLTFGPVMVNKAGIQVSRKSYGWDEVQQVSIQQGILKVSKKGGGWFSSARAAAAAIPNLRVLLNVLDRLAGIQIGK